jgi:hypothetical protein
MSASTPTSTSADSAGLPAKKPKKPRGSNVTKTDKSLFLRLVQFHDKDGILFVTSKTDRVKEKKAKAWEGIIRYITFPRTNPLAISCMICLQAR